MSSLGYDPIMLDFMPIKEWLDADSQDNMVILRDERFGDYIFQKKNVGGILLKKSYFMNGSINDIYNRCELKDGVDLLVKKTYDSKFYRNIGKYIIDDKKMEQKKKIPLAGRRMIDDKKFIRELKKKKNIYELRTLGVNEPFINRNALELSKISLAGGDAGGFLIDVFDLAKDSAFQDLYFEAKQAEALYKYSTIWDQPINNYLRLTKPVFDEWFTKFCEKRREKKSEGSNWSESKTLETVKRKVKLLDQCFLEHADRNENDTKKYYRGMQWGYGDYKNAKVGDKVLIQNFTSVSTVKKEAEYFKRGKECCMYLITVDKGIPMINMMKTTKYKKEKEILLPRDVILEYTKVITKKVKTKNYWDLVHLTKSQGYSAKEAKEMSSMALETTAVTFHVTIRKRDRDQFKVDHTCRYYPIYDLNVSKKKLKDLSVETGDVVEELEPVQEESKEDNHSLMKECVVNATILFKLNKEEGMKMDSKVKEYSEKGGFIGKVPKNELEKFNKEILKKIEEFSSTQPKKECPPGKELNPKTNRCRKIQVQKVKKSVQKSVQKSVKKECPPGKELNPKTNRCRKIQVQKVKKSVKKSIQKSVQKSVKKECPPGKELNPKTNRCRKIQVQKVKKSVQKSVKKECPPGKELNPKTGRCRKITLKNIPKQTAPPIIKDVLDNLITINGHGTFTPQKVKVPEGFQVLIPHRNGLDADYTTPDADKNKLYEEQLYKKNYLNYRDGWKLYLPGDDINNLKVSVFHDGASCHTIQDTHKIQSDLIRVQECSHQYEHGVSYRPFCPLYCTHKLQNSVWGDFDYLKYKNKRKLKIKACHNYRLNDLFTGLQKKLDKIPNNVRKKISPGPGEPIVLIPFTCNAKSGSKMNPFDHDNKKHLNTIYQELIKNR